MTFAAPGVCRRDPGEQRPSRYRRKPKPQHAFHVEAAEQAAREAQAWKFVANRLRPR